MALCTLLAGCQAPWAPSGPTDIVLRIPDRDAFLDNSLTVLRSCDLEPERVDRERGLIVTYRTTRKQWFEFWRGDAPGLYQLLESSLSTVAGTVTITVEPVTAAASQPLANAPTGAALDAASVEQPVTGPAPASTSAPADQYRVTVRVDKSRYSGSERQITTPSGAMGMFSEKVPTVSGQRGAQSAAAHWIPLGRDPLSEARLLAKVIDATPEAETVD